MALGLGRPLPPHFLPGLTGDGGGGATVYVLVRCPPPATQTAEGGEG